MSTSPFAISIVDPVTITDAMLVSTNVPENDYPAWVGGSPATTYALGDRVILTSTHRIYESLQNSNTNKNPETETDWWIEVSPTNRWKAFDLSNQSQTVYSGSSPPNITFEVELGQVVGCIGILNLTGASLVSVTVDDPIYGIVYDEEYDISQVPLQSSWWHWFFGTRTQASNQVIIQDIPAYPNATITVSITGNTSLAVGVIVFGQANQFSLGMKYGARLGIQDYSRKEANDFGDTVFVVRAFAKRATYEIFLDNDEVDQLQSYLSSIRAKPVLWIGSTEYELTTIFGFYKNFDILLSYTDHAECSLEIEGLT